MDTILCQRRESTSQVCFWEACLLFPVETNHTIHPQTNTTTNRPHIASHAVAPETIWTLNVKVTLKNVIALEQSSLNSTCLSHFVLGLKANLRACVKFTQVTFIMLMFHTIMSQCVSPSFQTAFLLLNRSKPDRSVLVQSSCLFF